MNQIEKTQYEVERLIENQKLEIIKKTEALNQFVKFEESYQTVYGKVVYVDVDLNKQTVDLHINIPKIPICNGFGFWEDVHKYDSKLTYDIDNLDAIKSIFVSKEEFEAEYEGYIKKAMDDCRKKLNYTLEYHRELPKEVPPLNKDIEKDIDESKSWYESYKEILKNRE